MSFLTAAPESMTLAAADLANIGSAISAAHMVAATPTVAVIPAAADEVSSSIAHLFSQHAQDYQALAGQAAAFHEQFVQHLTSSAGSYASAEAASAALLQPLTASAGAFAAANTALENALTNALTVALAIITLPIIGVLLLPFLSVVAVALGIVLIIFALGAALAALGQIL